MKSNDVRLIARRLHEEGKSYGAIAEILGITRYSARHLAIYKLRVKKKKTGPKNKINKSINLSMKREIARLNDNHEKINSPKLLRNLGLDVSERTVRRQLLKMDYKYGKASNQIILSKKHKQQRMDVISPWENTVFSDEKRFFLDGPDNWMTYIKRKSKYVRQKRQCHGGGIMVWLMTLPNGLLSFHSIIGQFRSIQYIAMLDKYIVPVMKINFPCKFYFQQDNCSVHMSKLVKEYLKKVNVQTVTWPSKSPDLNIVEDVWKIISDLVYDGPQFDNLKDLQRKISEVIEIINSTKRQVIIDLYGSVRGRLCKVLKSNGNMYNC